MVGAEQLESRVQQECSEEIGDPFKSGNKSGARGDHRAAQEERAHDAPEQQAMLVAGIDAKILEDQQENKNVIQAERFFDNVAGEKLEPGSAAMRNEKSTRQNRAKEQSRPRFRWPLRAMQLRERADETAPDRGKGGARRRR